MSLLTVLRGWFYTGAPPPVIPAGYRRVRLRPHRRTARLLPGRSATLHPHRRMSRLA